MSDFRRILWEIIEKSKREGVRPSKEDISKAAIDHGIPKDYWHFLPVETIANSFTCPSFIPEFISSYLRDLNVTSILDPFAGFGTMLLPVVDKLRPSTAIGLVSTEEELRVSSLEHDPPTIQWKLGNPFTMLDSLDERFDAILSCIPWGWRPDSIQLESPTGLVNIHDDLGNLVLLKSSMLLNTQGLGFFVASPGFMTRRNDRTVRSNLERFDLFIDAAISLPSGTFSPTTQLNGFLIVVRRTRPSQLFIGELTPDSGSSEILLRNLRTRSEGKAPQLGALVEIEAFRSFQKFVVEQEVLKEVQGSGLTAIAISEIASEINLENKKLDHGFEEKANSVYLPLIGRSAVIASLSNLQIKSQNYAQLVLKPEVANAAYLANFLNTPLGLKIRESLLEGSFIPKITKSSLLKAKFFLPSISRQIEAVRVSTLLQDLSTELTGLERELWKYPNNTKQIEKKMKSFHQGDNFEVWMDSLAFPLASILWAYHVESNNAEHAIEHLLHFFEALSEYLVVVMLSAYAGDKNFYNQERPRWIDKDPKYRDAYQTASFGTWNILAERLAKTTRTFLTDKEKRDRCIELFGFPNADFLDAITEKQIFSALKEVAGYRNSWKHGGIVSSEDVSTRLTLLQTNLSTLRKLISDHFSTALLLSPETSEYEDGLYRYRVKELMGTRLAFKKSQIITLSPMDKKKLYLIHENQRRPVELLPFIRMKESPRTHQNACYFYNRFTGGNVRWVSYHFETESEVIEPDDEVKSALSLLSPLDN